MKTLLSLAVAMMAWLVLPAAAKDVPKQLPDLGGKAPDTNKPVKVFVLLGQSNMLGAGKIGPETKDGTLEDATR